MNRNNMPLILMLAAGAITWIVTFLSKNSVVHQLVAVFLVLLIFYILGCILKSTLDYFDKQNEKRMKEAGEMIEKEVDNQTEKKESKE